MDTDVADMFGAIRQQLGELIATTERIEDQTKETNGHVADAFKEIDELKKINDVKTGALAATSKITRGLGTFALIFGGLFGGVIALEFGKLIGIYH